MTAKPLSRRAALAASAGWLPALLAACGGPAPPTTFAPLTWDYLPRIRLNVASIDIDDTWKPRPGTREMGFLAPTPPVETLTRMAQDRLVPGGASGRAVFVIEDASIVQARNSYYGHFAVRLDVSTSDGTRSGYAEAQVARTRAVKDDSVAGVRAELYDMVRQMMSDMNVEFEFQVRRSLKDTLLSSDAVAPPPAPVEQQELGPPPAESLPPAGSPPPVAAPPPPPPPVPSPPRPSAVPFSSPAPTPLAR